MPTQDTWSNAVKELWAEQCSWRHEHPVYYWGGIMLPVACGTIRGWLLHLNGYTQWDSFLFGIKNMVGAAATIGLWVWLFSRHDHSSSAVSSK